MAADFHTSYRNPSLRERLRHRPGLQQCDDLVRELIAIHCGDEIDQAALGTTGVEARNQMTDFDRQNSRTARYDRTPRRCRKAMT